MFFRLSPSLAARGRVGVRVTVVKDLTVPSQPPRSLREQGEGSSGAILDLSSNI